MKDYKSILFDHKGKVTDKWSSYVEIYDKLFSNFRDQPINYLEIGIQNGGSLEICAKYFSAGKNIVGVDINEDCKKLDFLDKRISLVIGDCNSAEIEAKIASISEKYDLILDDGSHISSDIIKAFLLYFPRLADGGIFIIEDLHCSYWEKFEGGIHHPFSAINFFKMLVDILNQEYWGIQDKRKDLLAYITEKFSVDISEKELAKIHSIKFFNSICIIQKKNIDYNKIGNRLQIGIETKVAPKASAIHHAVPIQDMTQSEYSKIDLPMHEKLISKEEELRDKDNIIRDKDNIIRDKDNIIQEKTDLVSKLNTDLSTITKSKMYRILKLLRIF